MSAVVQVTGLSKSYGDVHALRDVSLSVEQGELFGLIGPDGAGKTSLYKILTTLMQPDSGKATVLGLNTVRDYRAIRSRIGYMPERFSLYQDMTVRENLEFFAALFGVTVRQNYDLIAPIFAQLERFPNRRAGALSGGMKQKLALSCALIHKPEILFLDEPTTGVDAVSRSEFWEMLNGLRRQGITMMVSTSYMDEAQLCDRIALIGNGRILRTDTPERLVAGLDEQLWNACADNMYGLLEAIRKLPHVAECYTFGATLHVVAEDGFDPEAAKRQLEAGGLKNVEIYPAQGDIEDLFIKLARNE
ncbi:MAG: ABC transporter ATP-binding protein [Bacteroidales bacterium]|nr:ABC transporter ATP-binding protein [Bacteroidales bacterium]